MWPDRPQRRSLLLLLALAGCGFTPAYLPSGPGLRLRDRLRLEVPATAAGFHLRTRLEDRLGLAGGAPEAILAAVPAVDVLPAAVQPDGAASRYLLNGSATWRLTAADGRLLGEGRVEGFTAYASTGSTVAVRAAEEDARTRLMTLLADGIVAELLLLPPEVLP